MKFNKIITSPQSNQSISTVDKINSTIFKQQTIQSWFSGTKNSINNEVVQPFQNAEQVIWKYNQAIQHNSLTQKGWERLLAQSDDGLKTYLTNIKGTTASMVGYTTFLQGSISGFKKVSTAITQYNVLASSGIQKQNEFSNAVAITNGQLGGYLKGLNGAKASLGGYANSLVSATAKTVLLQTATIALNAAVSMGITAAISVAIKAFDKLINSAKRASEAADEAFFDTNEKVQQNEQEAKSLDELISKYKELKQNSTLDVESRKEVKELQNDIADLVGTQAKNLDLVNGKLDDEIKKLNEISAKEAKNNYETATANYNNAKKATENAIGDSSILFADGYAYVGGREKEAEKILQEAGFANYDMYGRQIGGRGVTNNGFSTIVFDTYDKDGNILKGAQGKADYLQSMIDVLEQNGQRSTDLYAGLIKQRDNYLTYIDNQQNAADSLINSWIIYSQSSNKELSKINVDSVESFDVYRQKMIEEIQKDGTIVQMVADGVLSEKDLANAINDYMATSINFSTWYEQLINNLKITSDQNPIEANLSISDTIDNLNTQLKPTFDALKDAYQSIFKMDEGETSFSLDDVDISTFESIKSAISELDEIEGIDIDYSTFDNFAKVLSDTSSTSEEVQDQFDKLATSIVYSSDCTEMSADNFDLLCKSLYEMGLTNAREVLTNIKNAQEELKASGIDLNNVTGEQAQAFLNEAGASDIAKEYLRMYMIQKQLASEPLDTSGSIQNLKNLCTQLGMTCNELGKTSEMMQAILSLESATNAISAGVDYSGQYARQAEAAKQKINELTNGDGESFNFNFNSNVTSPAKDKSSSDSNKPSEVTQDFPWIEKYLESFARKTEKIMNRISDYLSFKKNLSTIKSAIKAIRTELSANEKALAEYEKQMNAVGLSQTYIDKIKNGELNIETITGYETDGNKDANAQLIEKIEKYQDLYDQYTSIEDTIEELKDTEREWLVKNLEYINDYYQKLSDLKNLAIDKKQDDIDLKEAQGKRVTTGDYSNLISNNEAYIKSLRTTYKKTNAEFNKLVKNGIIEKESAEWFEWTENLADLNSEIVQAQINTAEWKDEINQIKIDNYTSSLDRLEAKYDKLNTAISRKESSNIVVTQSDYNKVIKNLDQQITKNNKLLALYQELQSQTQKNSEKWKEYQELIEQTESTVESLRDSIIETAQKIADTIAEIRDLKLEDNENASNLLSAKYDNATTASERNKNLDEQDKLAKSNLEINQQAYNDYTDQANQLGKELSQYISNATKGVTQSNTLIADTSNALQKERESYNSYANAYAKAQEKYSKATTKAEKSSAKAEMKNLSVMMEESTEKIKALETALSSYNTGLTENQNVLSQLDGYEFGKEIDLSKITDEDLLEKAAQYNETLKQQKQALIDTGLSEQEAIKVLRENASQRIQNILDEAEALDVLNQAMKNQIKSKIDLNKIQGYAISDMEYETYINEGTKGIRLYQEKYQEALEQFNKNLQSGVYEDNEELYLKDKANIEALKTSIYEEMSDQESMLDEVFQLRIDALTEEKEALQKLYDLQQRRYKLEEAQYNLEKAKQRTNLVYNGTEFVYQADTNALKEAEKALEEAKYNELINKIDDWIQAMEDAKEDFNLYDADGNPLGSTADIIEAAIKYGDDFLDGLEKIFKLNNLEYSDGEIKQIQTFVESSIVGKFQDSKFDVIAKALGEDKLIAVKDDEMVLTKMQSDEMYKQLMGVTPVPIMDLKPIVPDNLVKVNTAPISVDMSGMQFNEVQNMDQFTREIQKMAQKASSMIDMELGKRRI